MCKHQNLVMNKSAPKQKGYKLAYKRCRKQKSNSKLKIKTLKKSCKQDGEGPMQYSFYCIVNSGFFKSRGSLVSSVARGFLELYNKLARDRVKSKYLDDWEDSGEKLVIMKGINHKHLEYLAEELYYAAVDIHSFYKEWSRNKILLVLSVLGREEDLEDFLDGLTELR